MNAITYGKGLYELTESQYADLTERLDDVPYYTDETAATEWIVYDLLMDEGIFVSEPKMPRPERVERFEPETRREATPPKRTRPNPNFDKLELENLKLREQITRLRQQNVRKIEREVKLKERQLKPKKPTKGQNTWTLIQVLIILYIVFWCLDNMK